MSNGKIKLKKFNDIALCLYFGSVMVTMAVHRFPAWTIFPLGLFGALLWAVGEIEK